MARPEAVTRDTPDWVWPVAAFATIALFLVYLWWASRESEVRIIEDSAGGGARATASAAEFATGPARFSGRIVHLDTVIVAYRLGRAAFEIRLPERPPYPVVLERHLIEAGVQVTTDDQVNLVGSVYALNDSIIAAWGARGVFDITQADSLAGDSTFLLADSVQILIPETPPSQPTPPAEPAGRPRS